eukprot:scaffold44461_cov183-Amphora_coffeaeformis.AAC.1
MKFTNFLILALQPLFLQAFAPCTQQPSRKMRSSKLASSSVDNNNKNNHNELSESTTTTCHGAVAVNRRTWMQQGITLVSSAAASLSFVPNPALAAGRPPLDDLLYTILRVREATEQESRLITSGKFKDVQRANVKLAVRFMVENYRLADAFVAAAAYLDGNERRIAAGDAGQAAVQNLVTILEYFDSADVQNLKVGGWVGLVLVATSLLVCCHRPTFSLSHLCMNTPVGRFQHHVRQGRIGTQGVGCGATKY